MLKGERKDEQEFMVDPVQSIKVSVCGVSDIGCVREKNEDVWDQIPQENFFVLADGMGGHRAGDVAAKEAVRALLKIVQSRFCALPEERRTCQEAARAIRIAMEEVNRIIYELGKTEEEWRGMGTTLCCVHLQPEGLVYAHVGDSRIYRFRDGVLQQLTDDHSLLREMIRLGQVEDQPRADFAYKNIITKAIGTEPIVEPSVNITDLIDKDIILMCTDGLSDLLNLEQIEVTLKTTSGLRRTAEALVAQAKALGGSDNVTVVLVKAHGVDAASDLS